MRACLHLLGNPRNMLDSTTSINKLYNKIFISRVEEGVRQSPGSEKFSHTFCQVFFDFVCCGRRFNILSVELNILLGCSGLN